MKKTRILSLLLCAVLFCTLAVPATTAYAEEEEKDSGMVLSKTAEANADGTYTITLEAYATGEKTISTETKDVPTDIVLVLDLSSSMSRDIGTVSYSAYSNKTNEVLYALRHNGGEGDLWYKVDDSYYSVSVTAAGREPNYTNASNYTNRTLYNTYRNNLYAKIGDEYVKVTVERSGRNNYTYTYTYNASTVTKTSSGQNSRPTFDTGVSLWVLNGVDTTSAVYTYTYTDSSGTKTITTSTGGTTVPTGATFYSRSTSTSGGGTRLAALKEACNTFAEAVAEKAKGADETAGTDDDVKHRIAIVGFNSSSTRYTGTSAASALIDMSTATGESTVETAVTTLKTSQGTVPATGLSTANDIFAANPVAEGETRNRVVIFFTDGYPSTSGADNFDMTLANNAIAQATTAKNTHGATVYSIAVITGADPTSAGDKDGTNPEKVNWYLHNISSNKDGKPQTPSYYLSAADAASLKNIFEQISQQIETGGSDSKLTDEAVVRDIVSPYFTLPSGATVNDITLESYAYHGPNQEWTKNETALGAAASLDKVEDEETGVEQNRVSVTGFNFSENWCGTESQTGTTGAVSYRGNKLVIRFTVTPRAGFLGGNGVQTNNGAGVYENKDATTAVESVDDQTVDVAIKKPNVSVPDANVYLGAYFTETVSAEALKAGTTVSFGTGDDVVTLDMSKPNDNWGLASWQNKYVDIEVEVKDASGNVVTEFSDLRNDTKYTVSVTIKPKGAASGDDSSASGTIHVFKPELTYKDTTAYYGESVPENNNYSENMVGDAKWKNGDKYSTDAGVTMLGSQTPPTLSISYTPDSAKIFDGKYGKEDVPVKATVKIGTEDVTNDTTFVHTPCEQGEELPDGAQFLIHLKTCTLAVTKQGGAANESYVFDVKKDGVKYSEVTIWGNGTAELVELPIGKYTIKENTGWSWRYTASDGGEAELTAASPSGTITCTNTKANEKWFNGYSAVVSNVIGR